jgi:hypothetical protein
MSGQKGRSGKGSGGPGRGQGRKPSGKKNHCFYCKPKAATKFREYLNNPMSMAIIKLNDKTLEKVKSYMELTDPEMDLEFAIGCLVELGLNALEESAVIKKLVEEVNWDAKLMIGCE